MVMLVAREMRKCGGWLHYVSVVLEGIQLHDFCKEIELLVLKLKVVFLKSVLEWLKDFVLVTHGGGLEHLC